MSKAKGMHRLVHWFQERAGYVRTEWFFRRSGQTVRTVETVECQERTILVGRLQGGDSDTCPLCGSTLRTNPEDRMRPQLRE
jgi:oxalate decarboxylase/phosphoglucose isomerase-like protein (cupin superfamily)